jgi:beta-lactamase superfamily II metal-dependent hydrolase
VVDGGNKAHQAAVKVVALSNKEALLTGDGIKAGEPVISDGNYNLPDGAGVVKEQGKNE